MSTKNIYGSGEGIRTVYEITCNFLKMWRGLIIEMPMEPVFSFQIRIYMVKDLNSFWD